MAEIKEKGQNYPVHPGVLFPLLPITPCLIVHKSRLLAGVNTNPLAMVNWERLTEALPVWKVINFNLERKLSYFLLDFGDLFKSIAHGLKYVAQTCAFRVGPTPLLLVKWSIIWDQSKTTDLQLDFSLILVLIITMLIFFF